VDIDVLSEIVIARPREEVSAYACDPDNARSWYRKIKRVEWQTPRPLAAGSRIAFVARFLGKGLDYTYEVRELEPGRRLVMSTDEGPFPMRTTYEFEDAPGGGTRMTLRNSSEKSGFAKPSRSLIMASMRRANRKDLKRLKRILERG
jgi:uncharacterized protein YndB with AHSA1/START domain